MTQKGFILKQLKPRNTLTLHNVRGYCYERHLEVQQIMNNAVNISASADSLPGSKYAQGPLYHISELFRKKKYEDVLYACEEIIPRIKKANIDMKNAKEAMENLFPGQIPSNFNDITKETILDGLYHFKISSLTQLGNYEKAMELCNEGLEIFGPGEEYYILKSEIYILEKRLEEAIEVLSIGFYQLQSVVCGVNLTVCLAQTQKYNEAIELCNIILKSTEQTDSFSEALHTTKILCLMISEKYEPALEAIDIALNLGYNRTLLLEKKFELVIKFSRLEEANIILQELCSCSKKPLKHLLKRVVILKLLNRNDEALSVCETAEKISASVIEVYTLKSEILTLLHRYEEGIVACSRALMIKKSLEIYMRKIQCERALGKNDAALSTCDYALIVYPDDPDLLHQKGSLYGLGGRSLEALEIFDKVLSLKPHEPLVMISKGEILTQIGKIDEGCRLIEQALDIMPQSEEKKMVQLQLTQIYMKTGQNEKAAQLMVSKMKLEDISKMIGGAIQFPQIGNKKL